MFEYVLNQKGNKFYSLNEDIIIEAETSYEKSSIN